MANAFPNAPVLPSPNEITDPATKKWATDLLNTLQQYLQQVGQQIGQPTAGPLVYTPNLQATYQLQVTNTGTINPVKIP